MREVRLIVGSKGEGSVGQGEGLRLVKEWVFGWSKRGASVGQRAGLRLVKERGFARAKRGPSVGPRDVLRLVKDQFIRVVSKLTRPV